MAEVPVPFTEEEVDTSDGKGAVMTVALLIAGFGVFSMAQGIGGTLANTATNKIAQVTGYDPTTGQDTGADVL